MMEDSKWEAQFCKSGEVVFYVNKATGRHKWPEDRAHHIGVPGTEERAIKSEHDVAIHAENVCSREKDICDPSACRPFKYPGLFPSSCKAESNIAQSNHKSNARFALKGKNRNLADVVKTVLQSLGQDDKETTRLAPVWRDKQPAGLSDAVDGNSDCDDDDEDEEDEGEYETDKGDDCSNFSDELSNYEHEVLSDEDELGMPNMLREKSLSNRVRKLFRSQNHLKNLSKKVGQTQQEAAQLYDATSEIVSSCSSTNARQFQPESNSSHRATYSCGICGNMFLSVQLLDIHFRTHKFDNFVCCPVCNYFFDQFELVHHIEEHKYDADCSSNGTFAGKQGSCISNSSPVERTENNNSPAKVSSMGEGCVIIKKEKEETALQSSDPGDSPSNTSIGYYISSSDKYFQSLEFDNFRKNYRPPQTTETQTLNGDVHEADISSSRDETVPRTEGESVCSSRERRMASYNCGFCDSSFPSLRQLDVHMKKHSSESDPILDSSLGPGNYSGTSVGRFQGILHATQSPAWNGTYELYDPLFCPAARPSLARAPNTDGISSRRPSAAIPLNRSASSYEAYGCNAQGPLTTEVTGTRLLLSGDEFPESSTFLVLESNEVPESSPITDAKQVTPSTYEFSGCVPVSESKIIDDSSFSRTTKVGDEAKDKDDKSSKCSVEDSKINTLVLGGSESTGSSTSQMEITHREIPCDTSASHTISSQDHHKVISCPKCTRQFTSERAFQFHIDFHKRNNLKRARCDSKSAASKHDIGKGDEDGKDDRTSKVEQYHFDLNGKQTAEDDQKNDSAEKRRASTRNNDFLRCDLTQTPTFQCPKCESVFLNVAALKSHLQNYVHSYKCDKCDMVCSTVSNLTNHKRAHEERKRTHVVGIAVPKDVTDPAARGKLKNSRLQSAEDVDDEEQPVTDERNLDSRSTIVATKKIHICPKCERRFITSDKLQFHLRHFNHSFKCDDCEEVFSASSQLRRHRRLEHKQVGKDVQKAFEAVADAIRKEKDALKSDNHESSGDDSSRKTETRNPVAPRRKCWTCSECGLEFYLKRSLRKHILIHKGTKLYQCDQCNKGYNNTRSLLQHKRLHSGERPYRCDVCTKTFRSAKQKNIHSLTHLNRKSFHCPKCKKGFTQYSSLSRHRLTHSGAKPYTCQECDKSFSQTNSLARHREVVHQGKRFQCTNCEVSYTQQFFLKKHMKTCHKK